MSRPRRTEPWLSQRNHGVFYAAWYDPYARKTCRKTLATTDPSVAKIAFAAFVSTFRPQVGPAKGSPRVWAHWAAKMCKRARENARAKGRPYDLTPEYVERMMADQKHRCAVSGIVFDAKVSYRNPFAPSLDQIQPGKGYTPDNVRVVLVIVNTAMNGWGEEPLLRLIFESRLTRHGALSAAPNTAPLVLEKTQ